ncbi:MAG: RNA methyltransferase [Crocinitomicaceae bacterium]|nr:RNA methyltransferase [Crocinitomicaceae bacterium]
MHQNELKILKEFYNIISESKQLMFDAIAAERTKHLTVVLENIHQEHNASAVMRSCDCFGIQDLHVIEKNNQYKVQRDIALGAGRWVDLYNFDKGENPSLDCIKKLKEKGYKIVATTPHTNDVTINELDLSQPIALVFGTEHTGISAEIIAEADEFVKIPMYGFSESFNISVSVAITLNVLRNRLEQSELNWKLSPEEQTALKIKWSKKILRAGNELEVAFRVRLFQKD